MESVSRNCHEPGGLTGDDCDCCPAVAVIANGHATPESPHVYIPADGTERCPSNDSGGCSPKASSSADECLNAKASSQVKAVQRRRQPLLPMKVLLPRQRTFDKDNHNGDVATRRASCPVPVLVGELAGSTAPQQLSSANAAMAVACDPMEARLVGRRMIPRYIGRSRSVTAPVVGSSVGARASRDKSEERSGQGSDRKVSSAPVHESVDRMSRSVDVRTNATPVARGRRNSEMTTTILGSADSSRAASATVRPPTPSSGSSGSGAKVMSMSMRIDLSRVQSKCGSMDNIGHTPRGGNVQVVSRKLDWKADAKVGSLDNARHTPRGGDKKIESRKLEWKAEPKVGSLHNMGHTPGGGEKKIASHKLHWESDARVGSLENSNHTPGGGDKKVETHSLHWEVQSKVGSLENSTHQPGGGNVKVETQKLTFRENAMAKTNTGLSSHKSMTNSMTSSMMGSISGCEEVECQPSDNPCS